MRKTFFLLVLMIVPVAGRAQTRVLTLDESINIAFSKSYDAARLEQTLINSQMNLRAADASLKSSGELVFNSLPNFKDGERQRESETGFTFERERFVDFQAQLFVNQPIRFSDGTFSLVASFDRFQNFSTVEIGGPEIPGQEISQDFTNYSPQLSLQFRQPLFTINRLQTNHRKAKLNLENTEQVYSRSQLDIVYNVTANFFGLFRSQKQYEIDSDNVKQAEEAYRLANLKQQAGLLPEVEVLRLQVDLANARNSAAASQAALAEREDQFKLLIGIPVEDSVEVMTELSYQPVTVSIEKAMGEALNRRTELQSDEIDVELSQLSVRETDAQTQVRGDLFLTYGIFKRDENFSDAFRDF
ncbi:MAG TPA: TolC family protein, partial [bacterium]